MAVRRHRSWAEKWWPAVCAGPALACACLLLLGLLAVADSFAAIPAEVSGGGTCTQEWVVTPFAGGVGGVGGAGVARGAGGLALIGWNATRGGWGELRFGRWPALVGLDPSDGIDWSAVDGSAVEGSAASVSGAAVSSAPVVPATVPWSGFGGRQRRHVLDPNTEFGPRLRRVSHWNLASDGGASRRWVVWEERFFDVRDVGWGPENGFDQSRAFVGWAWVTGPLAEAGSAGQASLAGPPRLPGLGRPARVEFGYLNQTIDHPGRDADRRLHFFSFNLFF